ncbi:hypothetical protein [Paenibacillus sp. FJAT-26967]|uniref:hypothetical protein n=1 Tax=Paenibacillus sp. FJAT-26967 TaxID=1729690 RepID=UPI000A654D52|nr:hypothetical protein [Paenibacillus sp. FJAT-26967]
MSIVRYDLLNYKSMWGILPFLYLLMLAVTFFTADPEYPNNPLFYAETAFYPLLIMLTIGMFQRELSGAMEIFATFPISMKGMVLRKLGLLALFTVLYQISWHTAYRAKFGTVSTLVFSYSSPVEPQPQADAGIGSLLLQQLPALLFMCLLVITLLLLTKKIYTGLLAGLGIWMLDMLSHGSWMPYLALHTSFIKEHSRGLPGLFLTNRLLLTAAACLLLALTLLVADNRSRWIGHEEEE